MRKLLRKDRSVDASARVVSLVLLLSCLLGSVAATDVAIADDALALSGAANQSGQRFGTVWRVRGEIAATIGEAGKTRTLKVGDPVFVGERVRADVSAEAVLKTDDAGLIALRPGSIFVVERFAAEGKPADNLTVRIFVGGLRMITGWIGRSSRPAYRVVTPTATIGIRGTDHEPYVVTDELASTLSQAAGTYDKVNRGGTTLEANGKQLDIDVGKVGLARSARPVKTRALMTLLLPVLLERVPNFYVPGQFDAELDSLSASADENANRQLAERRGAQAERPIAELEPGAACVANDVAKKWLAQLDAAVMRRSVPALLGMFAPDIVIKATVRDQDGALTTIHIGRKDFADSTVAAARGLTNYKYRRPTIEGRAEPAGECDRVVVKSLVIEQGKQNGKPYRFESTEDYVLQRRAGKWIAIEAATTQR